MKEMDEFLREPRAASTRIRRVRSCVLDDRKWRSLGELNPCFSLERGITHTLANVNERQQTQ